MMELRAIETLYDGYKFRSRVEARWAVFFKAFGIIYEYEKEGYDLGKYGLYLPDFWLPKLNMFCEVKGSRPSEIEVEKAVELSRQSECNVAIVGGVPKDYCDWETYFGYCCWSQLGTYDDPYYFCKCNICGKYGYTYSGRIRQCECGLERRESNQGLFESACEKARMARFEHGERG